MATQLQIDNRTIVRIVVIIGSFVVGVWLVHTLKQPLVIIAMSIFLAMALNPPVSYLAKKMPKDSRGLATGVAYTVVLLILATMLYVTIPTIVEQSRNLSQKAPSYVENLSRGNDVVSRTVQRYELQDDIKAMQSELTQRLGFASNPLIALFERVTSSFVTVLTILVLAFFMLVEGPDWLDRFWTLMPENNRAHRKKLAYKMYRTVTGYVNGQLLIAVLSATTSLVVMSIVGIPFAIPLATIVGLFGLIPLIGATLAAVVVVTVSLFKSLTAAIIMLIFFIIYQQIENNVVQPIVQSKTVDVSPLTVLVAAIIGVSLAGFIGAIVAIPIAASLRILVLDYIDRKRLASPST
ncbi:AI-2E family transporter [Candidatus Saccharibacteria bacterium CPR2]|nr:AI-2E family transporter [Candidatus Saccharibacteria bacterium CPR2]